MWAFRRNNPTGSWFTMFSRVAWIYAGKTIEKPFYCTYIYIFSSVDWGQWGACTGSCGLGHRSRTGCHKFNKQGAQGKCLPPSTEETGACSLPVLCSSSANDFPGKVASSLMQSSRMSHVLPFAKKILEMISWDSCANVGMQHVILWLALFGASIN